MSRILVTCALGNVGREVVRACRARGLEVRGTDRSADAVSAAHEGVEAARLDFNDRTNWGPALEGCERVFLLRPPPIANMAATLNPFVDEAYARGVKHVVFMSVSGADRMKWVPHHKVEAHLQRHAPKDAWTILRPGFFAQNLQDAYRTDIVEDGRIFVPAAKGKVAFVDAKDIGEVAARVLQSPEAYRGRALTLTGPEAVTFDQAAGTLTQVLGRKVRYEPASILGYAWHLRWRRKLPWMQVAVQTVLHVGLRRGEAEAVDPAVEQVLGRRARTLSEYARDAAAVWRAA